MRIRTRLLGTAFAALGLLGVGAAPAVAAIDDVEGQPVPCWVWDNCPPGNPGGGGDDPGEEDADDDDHDDDLDVEVGGASAARPVRANASFTG